MNEVQQLIRRYLLEPHPEGGWFRQTYKSSGLIPKDALPESFTGDRPFSTAIYFLIEKGNFSAFHRIKSDECWHFYSGGPLQIYVIFPNGELTTISLGNKQESGEQFQYVVPAGAWFASRPDSTSSWCFVGCTVAPGFDFEDFELGKASTLTKSFPNHESLIRQLCR